jgi:hypothetical protein
LSDLTTIETVSGWAHKTNTCSSVSAKESQSSSNIGLLFRIIEDTFGTKLRIRYPVLPAECRMPDARTSTSQNQYQPEAVPARKK